MPTCVMCKSYYKQSQYNQTANCDACDTEMSSDPFEMFDDEDIVEIQHILNPTGKTNPIFND